MKYASILFLILLGFEVIYLLIRFKIYKNQKASSIEQLIEKVKEIDNQGFIKKLLSEIEKYNLDPSLIGIEITESSIIETKALTINNIDLIKEKGIKIYLYDFGIGYSSLSNLREIPADYIKNDRRFIENMDKSLVDERILRSLIDLANNLNLEIIAEGVETREKVEKMGCILLQGYYFSKPQPINKIIKG